MPPPGKPYTPTGAAGLSAPEENEVDCDYAFFLKYVRMDGNAYALYIPSKDGVSPPEVIRYEEPLDGSNVGAPVVGPKGRGQGGPPPSRAAPYGATHPRTGVKRKARDETPSVEARSGGPPMEEDAPAPQPAWYQSQPDIDEDYRFFLRHLRKANRHEAVFKVGNLSFPFGHERPVDNTYAEEEDTEEDEDESIPGLGQSGEDGAGTEEEVFAEKKAGVDLDLQVVNACDSEVKEEEVSEEEGEDDDSQEEEVDEEDEEWKVEGEVDSEVGPVSDLQIVNNLEFEIKDEMEVEDESSAPVKGITEQPLNREAGLTKGHAAIPRNALELQGVIWPPHITERPNSDFKKKLMLVLMKPYKQEEYDRYFSMATNRTPVVKERRTRHNVVYYPWKHELGKSYFDSHPDLAEQFKLQGNNYPNRLALLRGFFFWLQNVGQEDQFRPWRDDFRRYRVVSFP